MRTHQAEKLNKAKLQELLSTVSLPAMPDSAVQLLKIANDWDKDAADYARPIEADATLAAQVLRFVNSSYFGFRYQICSVKQAITLLGLQTIKNFVMWTAVFGIIVDPGKSGFSMLRFRCDAIRRALLARALAKRMGVADPEEVFTGGLLQDIALPLLVKSLGDDYLDLLEASQGSDTRLRDLEHEQYGWTHGDLGSRLLKRWELPTTLQKLLPYHSTPETVLKSYLKSGDVCAVAVSSLAPSVDDESWPELARFVECWEQLPKRQDADLLAVLQEVDEAYRDLAGLLEVKSSGHALAEQYAAASATLEVQS